MKKTSSRKADWNKDMFGVAVNRAKTWGGKRSNCPKTDRRDIKKALLRDK